MAEENKPQSQSSGGSAKGQNTTKEQSHDHDAAMAQQIEEMENDITIDETAATVVYPADIGYSSHALVKGVTTSPQFVERSKYERQVNSDPDRENKVFARDVLGLDVEVEDHPEHPQEVYGGQRGDQ